MVEETEGILTGGTHGFFKIVHFTDVYCLGFRERCVKLYSILLFVIKGENCFIMGRSTLKSRL